MKEIEKRLIFFLSVIFIIGMTIPTSVGEDEVPESKTDSSDGGTHWIDEMTILLSICAVGVIIGVRGLLNTKETEKWFYAVLIIISFICGFFIYDYYTWTLAM